MAEEDKAPTEEEISAFEANLIKFLTGTYAEVDGIGTPVLPLTSNGAQAVYDKLCARYKITRRD